MKFPRLKDLREDKELNQTEVGKILGTSQSYYASYERGERELPFYRAIELADFYNVSLDYIAGRTNDKRGIGYADSYKYYEQNNNQGNINNF